MTAVTGVRGQRGPTSWTPSSSIMGAIRSPAESCPSGEASAVASPSRAAPIAVIAPPPGVRTRSPAKRSSPSAGSPSRPTNVMSRKAGTTTTTSTLMPGTLSGCAATGQPRVDRLTHSAEHFPELRPRPAERTGIRRRDRGLRIVRQRVDRGASPDFQLFAARFERPLPGAIAGERARVAEQRRDVLEVEQRGAERLVALEHQIGGAVQSGKVGADALGRGLAGNALREFVEQLLRGL